MGATREGSQEDTLPVTSYSSVDGEPRAVPGDPYVHAPVSIDVPHHEIHEGDMFSACDAADVANGANRDILIVTGAKYTHMFAIVMSEAETDVKIYEGTTASNNGTTIASYNRNRNSAKTPVTAITHTPTVAGGSEGTLLCTKHYGSGKSLGGENRGENEWILKPNTKYLIRINNATTSNNYQSTELMWYEK